VALLCDSSHGAKLHLRRTPCLVRWHSGGEIFFELSREMKLQLLTQLDIGHFRVQDRAKTTT
jgi:hypothetical protein